MRGVFLYAENSKKIKGYSKQLSRVMDDFQVSGRFDFRHPHMIHTLNSMRGS